MLPNEYYEAKAKLALLESRHKNFPTPNNYRKVAEMRETFIVIIDKILLNKKD